MKRGEIVLGLLFIAAVIGGVLTVAIKDTHENGVLKANWKTIEDKIKDK